MAPSNPCTNPNIPPIHIELSHIPCNESHAQYVNGVLVVKAYWRQATNMTLEDQVEYKTLIEQQRFEKQGPSMLFSAPSDHSVYKSCQASPTWAKYVFIRALGVGTPALDSQVEGIFGSLNISDFEQCYRAYNPEPARVLKRRAESQLLQRSNDFSQWDIFPAAVQTLPDEGDLRELEDRLKEYMDDHLNRIQKIILPFAMKQKEGLERVTRQMFTVIDKMNQLEKEQTECFDAIETKIDCLNARPVDMGEI
ncbi:hypothetical protein TGAM01_v203471 [Trichoderma gamsii]|uniref:Uncharacterized protein n=1 Tax=Trichoderma gamsii TaxID=398673 RepID=A0A2P4ZTS9_9HYPO|nr:hypothetical protein TGAM01_v203471 [Trichoderma gamsii]PON27704.1 hypothetical protein TGAM01_v203471 [Trichoderma gamsii]